MKEHNKQGITDGYGQESVSRLTVDTSETYMDRTVEKIDKLKVFAPAVAAFIGKEPGTILGVPAALRVKDHATYGRLKVTLHTACTCDAEVTVTNPTCVFHCATPSLNDVVYNITRVVYSVFNSSFLCFANVFTDLVAEGLAPIHTITDHSLIHRRAKDEHDIMTL